MRLFVFTWAPWFFTRTKSRTRILIRTTHCAAANDGGDDNGQQIQMRRANIVLLAARQRAAFLLMTSTLGGVLKFVSLGLCGANLNPNSKCWTSHAQLVLSSLLLCGLLLFACAVRHWTVGRLLDCLDWRVSERQRRKQTWAGYPSARRRG